VHVKGHIYTSGWFPMVRGFVDILVVLTVPKLVVYFIAMYMMGLVSEVHRSAARTKLNVFGKFHGCIAKTFLAEVAFRGLLNNFTDRMKDLGTVTPQVLLKRLERIFGESLREDELTGMAAVVFSSMDKDHNGEIGCREFIEASTHDGEIPISLMTRFFQVRHGARLGRLQEMLQEMLREMLDDTHRQQNLVGTRSTFLFTPSDGSGLNVDSERSSHDSQTNMVHGSPETVRELTAQVAKHETELEKLIIRKKLDGGDVRGLTDQVAKHENELQKLLDDLKYITETLMHGLSDRVARHENELQKLLDDHKSTTETLMERMEQQDRSFSQALQTQRIDFLRSDTASRQALTRQNTQQGQ